MRQGLIRSQLLLLALGCCLLAGCSTSFTYNQLDWLIPWRMDEYVDFERDQKKLLKVKLEPLLDWHRCEELDRYVALVERMEMDVQDHLDVELVRGWLEEVMDAADRLEVSFLQMAVEMGESLSTGQVDDFVDRLWERQTELEKEYLARSDDKYRKDNFKSLSRNLRRFISNLDNDQAQTLRTAAASLQRFDFVWLEDRERWLKRLEVLLQRQPGWQQAVIQAHQEHSNSRSPNYNAIVSHNVNVMSAGIADVLNNLSEKQYSRLLRKLAGYRSDMQRLSNRPGPAMTAVTCES